MEKCYFKKISDSESKEGEAYLKRFDINFKKCKFKCSGYIGYGNCENFITQNEVNQGGLVRIASKLE